MESLAPMGIEGIVSKRRSSRYGAGRWSKTKFRETLEGVIGATIGPLSLPDALIIGRRTKAGDLVVLGRTRLTSTQSAEVGRLLLRAAGRIRGQTRWAAGISVVRRSRSPRPNSLSSLRSAQTRRSRLAAAAPLRFLRIRHDA